MATRTTPIWDNRFPSDRIIYALDLVENVPDVIVNKKNPRSSWLLRKLQKILDLENTETSGELHQKRVSLAVNTNYPEIQGGYYLNWRVLDHINRRINELGMHIVDPEYFSTAENAPFPSEHLLGVDLGEVYYICEDHGVEVGLLLKWQFSTGGGGPFFSDNLIIDIWLDEQNAERFVEILLKISDRDAINIERYALCDEGRA